MGVVTAHARLEGVVQPLDDLWEAGRPRRQVVVAVETGLAALARNQRGLRLRVVGVLVGGAVADLTGQTTVVGGVLDLALVVVAFHAEL